MEREGCERGDGRREVGGRGGIRRESEEAIENERMAMGKGR